MSKKSLMTAKRNLLFWSVSFLAMIISLYVTKWGNQLIKTEFAERVIPDDLLFRLLPYDIRFEYLADITVLCVGLIAFVLIMQKDILRSAYYLTITWIFFLLRAILMVLTPLERPTAPDYEHGLIRFADDSIIGQINNWGMFPSGHVGVTFLMVFFVANLARKDVKIALYILAIAEAVFMIASRGHYSIDVVGGIMLAIIVYIGAEKYLNEKMVLNK